MPSVKMWPNSLGADVTTSDSVLSIWFEHGGVSRFPLKCQEMRHGTHYTKIAVDSKSAMIDNAVSSWIKSRITWNEVI